MNKRFLILAALTAVAGLAKASSLSGDYYILANDHPDVLGGIDGGTVTGLIDNTLGPNGLPVVSSYGKTFAGASGPISDYDSTTSELLWWTAHSKVSYEKTQVDALPLSFSSNFFPDGHGNNAEGYRAVHWKGTFMTPGSGTINMTLAADDDAWVFVNGQLAMDAGGVKGLSAVPGQVAGLNPGLNTLDVFFADRHQVQSGIDFTADVNVQAVPEPTSMAVLGIGAIGLFARRRNRS